MTLEDLDAVCRALPAVTMVVQWGNSNVYKVGGKVFVWASENSVSFKASAVAYEVFVTEGRGVRAPYTKAGSNWLNLSPLTEQDRAKVGGLVADAHALIAAKLTRRARAELGLA